MAIKRQEERLRKLSKFLRKLKQTKSKIFDMQAWGQQLVQAPSLKVKVKGNKCEIKADANVCGTAACALGFASTIPEFERAGLKMKYRALNIDFTDETDKDSYGELGEEFFPAADGQVYYRGAQGEMAGAKFFGLSNDEANSLFLPGHYPSVGYISPEIVADRIDALLDGKWGTHDDHFHYPENV
jgi:hypothetical protein